MTQNKHLQFIKCYCGAAFKADNFKSHLKSVTAQARPEDHSDKKKKKVFFCCKCGKWPVVQEGQAEEQAVAEFSERHNSCPKYRFTKADLDRIVKGIKPLTPELLPGKEKVEEKKKQEVEVDLDKSETTAATEFLVRENKRSAEVVVDLPPLRRRLIVESDSEEEVFVFCPKNSSTPVDDVKTGDDRKKAEEEERKKAEEEERKKAEEEEKKKAEEEERKKAEEEEERKKAKEIVLEEKAEERRREFSRKNSIKRQQEWEREHAVEMTQERTFDTLNRRLANMKSARDKALDKLANAEAKMAMSTRWEEQVVSLLAEKKDLVEKEERLVGALEAERKKRSEAEKKGQQAEREKKEVEKKAQEAERRAEVAREKSQEAERRKEEMEKKAEEAEKKAREVEKKAQEELEEAKRREAHLSQRLAALEAESKRQGEGEVCLTAHLACREGRILGTSYDNDDEDPDRTTVCFDDHSRGVFCHHLRIKGGPSGRIEVKRLRNIRYVTFDD